MNSEDDVGAAREVRPALRALIARHHPNKKLAALAREKATPEHVLTKWFKTATATNRIPDLDTLGLLADVIGCSVNEVFVAFREDHGYIFDEEQDQRKAALNRGFDRMPPDKQRVAVQFVNHDEDWPIEVFVKLDILDQVDRDLFMVLLDRLAQRDASIERQLP